MVDLVVRFVVGGAIVSAFAVGGELFAPKTFSGLFGAAPSVALATLALAYHRHGAEYVAIEARSMFIGCFGMATYTAACIVAARLQRVPIWLSTGLSWIAWFAIALGGWYALRIAGVLT